MFALDSLSRGGCMLADEVGLGKTIEAGLAIGQLMAEGKTRILILAPATLRAQWNSELREKFDLESVLVDGRTVRATGNCFDQPFPVICSHPFAANKAALVGGDPLGRRRHRRGAPPAQRLPRRPQDGPGAAGRALRPPQAAAHRHPAPE